MNISVPRSGAAGRSSVPTSGKYAGLVAAKVVHWQTEVRQKQNAPVVGLLTEGSDDLRKAIQNSLNDVENQEVGLAIALSASIPQSNPSQMGEAKRSPPPATPAALAVQVAAPATPVDPVDAELESLLDTLNVDQSKFAPGPPVVFTLDYWYDRVKSNRRRGAAIDYSYMDEKGAIKMTVKNISVLVKDGTVTLFDAPKFEVGKSMDRADLPTGGSGILITEGANFDSGVFAYRGDKCIADIAVLKTKDGKLFRLQPLSRVW